MLNNIEKFLGDMFSSGGTGQLTPANPVELNEKWTTDITRDSGLAGELSGKFECSLDAVEETKAGKLALISFTGKLEQPEDQEKQRHLANALVKIRDIESNQKGSMKINHETHQPALYTCYVTTKIDMIVTRNIDRVVQEKKVSVTKTSEVWWKLTKFVKPGEKPVEKPEKTDAGTTDTE